MKAHLTILILLALTVMAEAEAYTLFNNGKSKYTIVVSDDASASEKYAARELQKWIGEVSGVKLPIASGGRPGRRIIVGWQQALMPDIEKPGRDDETTHLLSRGGDIMIWGGSTRGTLYAVYSFLEEEFGVRWYTSAASVAPKRNKWSFSGLERTDSPAITVRFNYSRDAFEPVFGARLRSNGWSRAHGDQTDSLGGGESFWGGHTLGEFIPTGEFFETHPEYFGLKDGKRNIYQRCLSNPDVLRIVTERLREKMRNDPTHLIYSVGQNDGYNPCECAECQAIKDKFGGQESGIIIWFVNQVADAVKDEFPDKYVGTFAYVYSRQAPENIKPRDNVVVRLCSIEECQLHGMNECWRNREFTGDLQAWSAIAPHLFIWDYVTTFTQYVAPMPNFWTFKDRIRTFRDNNAIGVMPQGNYSSLGGAEDPLRTWLLAKLMWNPDQDLNTLIDDFVYGFYGAAAPFILEYLDYERSMLVHEDLHPVCYPDEFCDIYSDEYINHGYEIMEKALDAVAGDEILTGRVELAKLPLCYLRIIRNQRGSIEPQDLLFFERVCKREKITHLCEAHGYASPMDFCNAMETGNYLELERNLYGNLTFYHENLPNVAFKRFAPGTQRPAGLEDALFTTYFWNGCNGVFTTELCMPAKVGGNSRGSYPFEGEIVPDTEYEASSVIGWKRSHYTMHGYDPDGKYVMAITSLTPEKIRFKVVRVR